MQYTYIPKGVCAKKIIFDIKDGIIKNVVFLGGCNGNAQGLSKLLEGQNANEIMKKLKGIDCGGRGTSCPAQFAEALKEILE